MRKTLVLTLVVMVFAICLQAQDAGKTSDTTTLTGCLSYVPQHYVLTDSSGTAHRLSGYANKLKPHVGHEVEITGKEGVHTTGLTEQGAASSAAQVPVFKVSSVKHIAATCSAGTK